MIALGIIDRILGIAGVIERRLGDRVRRWSEWAAENPDAAALQLELAASDLSARARARRRQDGWIARKHYARAWELRRQAREIRVRAAKGCG